MLRRLFYSIKKPYIWFFHKPHIKVGDKLSFHGKTCKNIYFNWKQGVWIIDTGDDLHPSWNLELWYRKNK